MKPPRRRRFHLPPALMEPSIDGSLKKVFNLIGRPKERPFQPDPFQLEALEAIREGDCLVTAPTGSGKTWIAREAIKGVLDSGGRAWYATPLKALSNSKWIEFGAYFGGQNVGILTGDTKENPEAPIIVGTTEILRNQMYDAMHEGTDFPCNLVVLDEAHYLGDPERGVVWEEVMIYLPARVHLLLLSATIGNAEEIAAWLSELRDKPCRVVREERRPVPLFPLFLNPTGRILPFMVKKKLNPQIRDFELEGRRIHVSPPFGEILKVMRALDLLPAIFFLKSRADCDAALKSCRRFDTERKDEGEFRRFLGEMLEKFPFLSNHRQLYYLEHCRVASHHGGQLPAWKFLVETMMNRGFLEAIFATTTVAAGVNYPARTIVMLNSDIFNGHDFAPLRGTEFHQMTGRAGRRGQDNIGFLMIIPGRFMDFRHIEGLLESGPESVESQIKADFSMVLNLLLSQSPEGIRQIVEQSFAVFQRRHRKKRGAQSLWKDFERHIAFLKEEGFVDEEDRLTFDGRWASQLRLDQPLLIAECLRKGALPENAALLAAMVSVFAYDGDQELRTRGFRHPPAKLLKAFRKVLSAVKPLQKKLEEKGFAVRPICFWPAQVIYDWARGWDWDDLVKGTGISDGELAMLVLRTADNLRQIRSLSATHEEIAAIAQEAIELILREPVVY
ncbi:MAG TPA: DEAD/DEAH box helicase [Syntrophales bacterium]|nr:DEAD/DEAH box helicase [Syntrophales bacterium]HOL58394.1 DEAD/DEAH box helicase [Syntrophales bacterium]HPO34563.1 DEAD/DEAH box helicase [Syntrophales bacterium]